tara:strand:+ start:3268 stop:4512 length:1245 start_codon:yes stop_codon:yes gene_type:complete
MTETKKEEVVESTTEQVTQEPKVEEKKSEDKITVKKKKPLLSKQNEEGVYKVDLTKPAKQSDVNVKDAVLDNPVDGSIDKPKQEEIIEELKPEVKEDKKEETTENTPVVEEITNEEDKEVKQVKEEVVKAVEETEATGKPLPENVEKLITFMDETGGDLEDYVKLNRDVNKLDDQDVLYEYYKQTKPHLNAEEINFMMNDQFEYDEEVDDEKQIKRKKLALKEQVASARAHLDGQKSKYYEDIKAGSKLTPEQQKAIEFFNRHNKESEQSQKIAKQQETTFSKKTNEVFNTDFKGFEYKVGDKKFRFNVKDVGQVKETQSNMNNFTKKFLNKDNVIEDAKGYHKSMFTAMNADAIAQHFYEQGKADAIKDRVAKDKNISLNPRQTHGEVETGGFKYKVLGESSSDYKFKIKKKR